MHSLTTKFTMKFFIILVSAILAINALSDQEEWTQFKLKYGKNYKLREEHRRFNIFQKNLRQIYEHNNKYETGESSYKLALNKFADLTQEEFNQRLTLLQPSISIKKQYVSFANYEVPVEVDWRLRGAVTEVKDQGDCGGCWAFGTTGALEGQYFLKTGTMLRLSEQLLLDCSGFYSNGCRGGWVMNGFRFIREYGIVTAEEYPYQAIEGECRANGTLFKNMGFVAVQENEEQLKAAVASVGPIAVAVDASYMYLYDGGVLDIPYCSSTVTNHAVLVVGYGTTADGIDYWLVKNSWGPDWGDDGYLKMARNKDNQCAIASEPLYPIIL